ncbi:MAG: GNAT family N-acetyltransferase [Chloroflexi bacterium]|nr:GNAT family N-acetyltransferase [Chloroflexota bacterium]MDA1146672.1 GNAT family N-acetyltransferase [Chloroflexota bacterium]MQC82785.1 GNAT family N-acetyltransferase [Chloroflexota bacterium]
MRDDLDSGQAAALAELAAAEPVVRDFEGEPPALEGYREIVGGVWAVTREYRGPAFIFPDELPAAPRAVLVGPADRALLPPHFAWAIEEWDDIQPVAVALDGGVAVAICHAPAGTAEAAEAGVFTIEAARGRGYAVEVVAAWAQAMRAAGRLPMYSTQWDNAASRRVAAKLRLELYGEDLNLT